MDDCKSMDILLAKKPERKNNEAIWRRSKLTEAGRQTTNSENDNNFLVQNKCICCKFYFNGSKQTQKKT